MRLTRLTAIIIIGLIIQSTLSAQTTLEVRVRVFKDIAEALDAAGDAIKSVTDGIAHFIKTGASGYSHVAASGERARMIGPYPRE